MPTAGPLVPVYRLEDHWNGVAVEEDTVRGPVESKTSENHSGNDEAKVAMGADVDLAKEAMGVKVDQAAQDEVIMPLRSHRQQQLLALMADYMT